MTRASGRQTLPIGLTALAVLFGVLMGAHLLAPGVADAAAGSAGAGVAADVHDSCLHSAGSDDSTRHLRHRLQRRVGNQMEPETAPPTGLTGAGADLIDAWHDSHRTAPAYDAGVPPRDTSPAALQVFRC